MQVYKNRKDVPDKYKWDLSDFFKTDEEFNKSLEETLNLVNDLIKYVGCTKNPELLYEFMGAEVDAIGKWENLYVYAYLINDQELGVSENVERLNKTRNLNAELNKNLSFFAPELLKLSKDEYKELYVKCPKLEEYKADLDRVYREKDYVLEENEERIIAEITGAMNSYAEMSSTLLNNQHDYGEITLDDGTVEKITTTNYRKIMRKSNRETRHEIYKSFFKVLDQYGQTEATILDSYVKKANILAKLHRFNSSWESKLFYLNATDKIYDNLVNVAENNLSSLQRYYDLKRKALKLDELHSYDMPLDMATSEKEYSIEEAQELVRKCLEPLGEEYLKCYDKIIDNHYIDYCQYPGKCSGGYSFSTIDHDSRILMSFNSDLDSVSTIAHEGGHNVHHQMVSAHNPLIYRDVTSMVSEVASLTNECLLSSYLSENGESREDKLAGIANFLGVFVSNFYGAIRECKMEQDMYKYSLEGNSLTKDYLYDLTKKSKEKYFGDKIKNDEYNGADWIIRSHYYMNFYLYSYAICVSIASYVASNILNGNTEILNNYMKFLSAGSDVWPVDAFKILGVDLEDKKVHEGAIKFFDEMLDKFEELSKEV